MENMIKSTVKNDLLKIFMCLWELLSPRRIPRNAPGWLPQLFLQAAYVLKTLPMNKTRLIISPLFVKESVHFISSKPQHKSVIDLQDLVFFEKFFLVVFLAYGPNRDREIHILIPMLLQGVKMAIFPCWGPGTSQCVWGNQVHFQTGTSPEP